MLLEQYKARDNWKKRISELEEKLSERIRNSDIKDSLFEYLILKRELNKEKLCKELDSHTQGKISELADLVEKLFLTTYQK